MEEPTKIIRTANLVGHSIICRKLKYGGIIELEECKTCIEHKGLVQISPETESDLPEQLSVKCTWQTLVPLVPNFEGVILPEEKKTGPKEIV